MKKISIIVSLLLVACGCSAQETNKNITVNETTAITTSVTESTEEQSLFRNGMWVYDHMRNTSNEYFNERRYYLFDGAKGSYKSQENKKYAEFTFHTDRSGNIVFNYDDGNEISYKISENNGEDTITLVSESGDKTVFSYFGDTAFDEFDFYSNEELIAMGKAYFMEDRGFITDYVEAEYRDGDNMALHFYWISESAMSTATIDWYTINRISGKGFTLLGNPVDLTVYKKILKKY